MATSSSATSLQQEMDGHCSRKGVGDDGAKAWAKKCADGQLKMESLEMGRNGIGDEGVTGLAEALKSGQCQLKSLELWGNNIGDKGAQSLAEALLSDRCKLKSLYLECNQIGDKGALELADALQHEHCNLESLELYFNPIKKAGQQALLNALKLNFKVKKLSCGWHSSLSTEAANLLDRNRIFSQTEIPEQEMVSPTIAKLFICGDPDVGKTTIARILADLNPKSRLNSTGMDLSAVQFGDRELKICDFAGQKEFHAFHHLFLKGAHKDLFLVVCRAPGSSRVHKPFRSALKYWLRFIASHRSPSSTKPRVLIAVNYFPDSRQHPINLNNVAYDLVQPCLKAYSKSLDFGQDPKHSVSGLTAINTVEMKPLKRELQTALEILLDQRPPVPRICQLITNEVKQVYRPSIWSNQNNFPKLVSLQEYASLLTDLIITHTVSADLFRDALEHLFDMAELIYLKEAKEFVILDVQWFAREVFGVFVQPEASQQHKDSFDLSEVKGELRKVCDDKYLDPVMSCLEKLRVFYTPQAESLIIVPTFLTQRLERWPENKSGRVFYIGRRYKCTKSNRRHRLLPSHIFIMLQENVRKQFYSNTYNVGDGWVSFITAGITFIIKIGGKKDLWTDRQWIDVMLRAPSDSRENPKVEAEFLEVKKILSAPLDELDEYAILDELDEYVICPECVEKLATHHAHVALIDKIKQKAREEGPSSSQNWPHTDHETSVSELLLSGEWEDMIQQQLKKLENVELEIVELAGEEELKAIGQIETSVHVSFIDVGLHDKVNRVERLLNEIKCGQQELLKGQQEILRRLNKIHNLMQERAEELLQKLASLMGNSTTTLPCLPYFTDNSGLIPELIGKKYELHLLCESKIGGHHIIPNQKGINVTVPAEWVVQYSKILAPALTYLSVIAKIAAIGNIPFGGIPKFNWGLVDMVSVTIQGIVKNVIGTTTSPCDMFGKIRSDAELREFFSSIVHQGHDFKLSCVESQGQIAWLCAQHAQQYIDRGGRVLSNNLHF